MSSLPFVTDADFETEVLKSSLPVLIDFYADWCGPCKVMAPILEELARQYEGKIKIVKMDVDANSDTPSKFEIMSIPTMIFFKGGEMVERLIGATDKENVVKKIEAVM